MHRKLVVPAVIRAVCDPGASFLLVRNTSFAVCINISLTYEEATFMRHHDYLVTMDPDYIRKNHIVPCSCTPSSESIPRMLLYGDIYISQQYGMVPERHYRITTTKSSYFG